jgi:hypothetical protein
MNYLHQEKYLRDHGVYRMVNPASRALLIHRRYRTLGMVKKNFPNGQWWLLSEGSSGPHSRARSDEQLVGQLAGRVDGGVSAVVQHRECYLVCSGP